MKELSVIIPFGTSLKRSFLNSRVLEKIEELNGIEELEVIFVEGYSSKPDPNLKEKIESSGHKYYVDSTQTRFSQGACRNLGASMATAPVIMFLDVDYFISKSNIKKILDLIKLKQIDKNPNRFMCLPCAFLTEFGTSVLRTIPKEQWDLTIAYELITEKKQSVRFLAMMSSSMIVNRHKFLELGGNDPSYTGHGYEDFDVFWRLFKSSGLLDPKPVDLKFDYKSWNFYDYKGFRSMFSVPGYELAFYGIYLCHLWHPEPNNEGYLDNKKINHNKFYQRIDNYSNQNDGPDPLMSSNLYGNGVVLAFIKENSKVYKSLRGVMPYLGRILCTSEEIFFDESGFNEEVFSRFIEENNIGTVLFPNPYGNQKREEIYLYVRKNSINYLCYDRGALPDSWFFDKKGFNADSESYSEIKWNRELTEKELNKVNSYIEEIKTGSNYLESQGNQSGASRLIQKLGIRNKKIIFVPCQVETDSVIRKFTNEGLGYYQFFDTIDKIAEKARLKNTCIVLKKHPLMNTFPKDKYKNVIWAPDDANFIDLLNACDAVVTINSGVGIYAMIFGKPCALAGRAFYQIEGVNSYCRNAEELEDFILSSAYSIDMEKVRSFIYFLINDFYSFGVSYYSSVIKEKSTLRLVNYIDYYKIVIGDLKYLNGISSKKIKYDTTLLALRPYANEIYRQKSKTQSTTKTILNQVFKAENIKKENFTKLTEQEIKRRKIRKLFKHPYLYIRDFFIKKLA